MKHLTDQELMKLVQQGDHSAVPELYDRYSSRIYRFAYRMLRNPQLAEDCTQEVLLKMVRKAHQYKENSALVTWLYAITSNWCRDWFRRMEVRREEQYDESIYAAPAPPDPESGYRRVEHRQQVSMIEKAMERLNEDQREVIVLSRFHEFSYAEVAKIVGCSEGAVKTRIFRAMEAMREELIRLQALEPRPAGVVVPAPGVETEETNA